MGLRLAVGLLGQGLLKRSCVLIITNETRLSALNIPCVRVDFRSMPTNSMPVWFNIGSAAKQGFSYPLDIGDGKDEIYIRNLNELSFFFEASTDKIALVYEVE